MLDVPHSMSVLHRQAGEQDSQSADTSLFALRSFSLWRSCLTRLVAMVLMWSIRCDMAYRNDITHITHSSMACQCVQPTSSRQSRDLCCVD